MPYPLRILDISWQYYSGSPAFPLYVGDSFQANDFRIALVTAFNTSSSPSPSAPSVTSGWTRQASNAANGTGSFIYTQLLSATATDGTLTPGANSVYSNMTTMFTVRGMAPSQALSMTSGVGSSTASSFSFPSVTVSGMGYLFVGYQGQSANWPPSGMTNLNTSGGISLAGQAYTTSGSTGSKSISFASGTYFSYFYFFIPSPPDVSITLGTAAESDTASAMTAAVQNQTTIVLGTAYETDRANQLFTPLKGIRTSDPLTLPQAPVTNSVIHWEAQTPAPGSGVIVETSVDGGVSFQKCVNDRAIPRLLPGSNVWQTLQTRVVMWRKNMTDPKPFVSDVEVTVATDDPTDEIVSLGVFGINDTSMTMSGGTGSGGSGGGGGGDGVTGSGGGNTGGALALTLSGVDLSRLISRNQWEDVHYVPAGTNYAQAIMDIVNDRLPGCAFNFASSEHVTPKLVFGTQIHNDPWQDAQDLATAVGMELFFDAQGVCVLQDVPDPNTGQVVWELSDTENPTVVSVTRSINDATVFNYVTAYGESVDSAPPVYAIAQDLNPNSPTYVLGRYGRVPTTFTSPQITTVQQAQAAADALLNLSIGASDEVEVTIVPNPALECGDIVSLNLSGVKISGTFTIDSMTTSLSAAEGQTLVLYRQSIQS